MTIEKLNSVSNISNYKQEKLAAADQKEFFHTLSELFDNKIKTLQQDPNIAGVLRPADKTAPIV